MVLRNPFSKNPDSDNKLTDSSHICDEHYGMMKEMLVFLHHNKNLQKISHDGK